MPQFRQSVRAEAERRRVEEARQRAEAKRPSQDLLATTAKRGDAAAGQLPTQDNMALIMGALTRDQASELGRLPANVSKQKTNEILSTDQAASMFAELIAAPGIVINAPDADGWTLLHCAAFFCSAKFISLLLARGANTAVHDNKVGFTPLHYTAVHNPSVPTTVRHLPPGSLTLRAP
jgi:ankyrin repeat protein